MELFRKERIKSLGDKHLASEPHMRVQVLTITPKSFPEFWNNYHGELLIIVLEGKASLHTAGKIDEFEKGDQALLVDGEKFRILPSSDTDEAIIEFVWSPGNSSCKFCWELNEKIYGSAS